MKAIWNGVTIAESDDTVVVEGNHYFPAAALKREYVLPSDTHTTCHWKGEASYYSLNVNGTTNKDAVWYYPQSETRGQGRQGPRRVLERREGRGISPRRASRRQPRVSRLCGPCAPTASGIGC